MIYYGTFLIFYIVLTIVPIAIGFIFKSKPLRYFSWLIGSVFFCMTISLISTHSASVERQTKDFLGVYKIDLQKSTYKNGDLTKYQDLIMTVNEDNTFYFNDTSIFLSQNGEWIFKSTEDGGFVNCKFFGEDYEILAFVENNSWGFQQVCFRNGSNGDVIYFKK
jgi:hypothetical protein